MLPSLLAKDIQTGLKQFLVAAFEPADPFIHGLMSRFVEDEAAWLKGPYVQVGLPFVPGAAGRDFFAGFQTEFPAFSHQELAWQRLHHRVGQAHHGDEVADTIFARVLVPHSVHPERVDELFLDRHAGVEGRGRVLEDDRDDASDQSALRSGSLRDLLALEEPFFQK